MTKNKVEHECAGCGDILSEIEMFHSEERQEWYCWICAEDLGIDKK
jgi:hypothetical protein